MFKIIAMSPRSEDYLPSLVYFFGKRRRRKKGTSGDDPFDDDFPGDDTDGDEPGFGNVPPYHIDLPGEPDGIWVGAGAAALGLVGTVREEAYRRILPRLSSLHGRASGPERREGRSTPRLGGL